MSLILLDLMVNTNQFDPEQYVLCVPKEQASTHAVHYQNWEFCPQELGVLPHEVDRLPFRNPPQMPGVYSNQSGRWIRCNTEKENFVMTRVIQAVKRIEIELSDTTSFVVPKNAVQRDWNSEGTPITQIRFADDFPIPIFAGMSFDILSEKPFETFCANFSEYGFYDDGNLIEDPDHVVRIFEEHFMPHIKSEHLSVKQVSQLC